MRENGAINAVRTRATIWIATVVLLTTVGGAGAQIVPGRIGPAAPPPPIAAEKLAMPKDRIGASVRGSRDTISDPTCPIMSKLENCLDKDFKISGEAKAAFRYTFVGAIFYNGRDGSQYICTGTLLTPTLVLTAGHCACGIPGTYWVSFKHDSRGKPSGDLGLGAVDGPPILYDEQFCRRGRFGGGNDLALLRLRNAYPLQKEEHLKPKEEKPKEEKPEEEKPYKLPSFSDPPELYWSLRDTLFVGRRLIAVGYGYSTAGTVGIRLQGSIPIASAGCEEPAFRSICSSFSEMVLADAPGPRARTDTCGGDSGGPVFLVDGDEPKLIAVTSRAAPAAHDNTTLHCGGGGIYTLIGRKSVHAWLLAHGVARKPPQQSPKPEQ
jgi:hypothetical protein